MGILKVLGKEKCLSFIMCLFGGCQQANHLGNESDLDQVSLRVGVNLGQKELNFGNQLENIINAYKRTPYCVWLHGMLDNNELLGDFVDKLCRFKEDSAIAKCKNLFLKARLGKISTTLYSFKKQADAVYKELKKILYKELCQTYGKIWSKRQCKQALKAIIKHIPIVLCGFSQGGSIAVEIGWDRATYGLNIIGEILMLTDLSGVVPFQEDMEDLERFKGSDIRDGFEIVLGQSVKPNYRNMSFAKFGVGFVSPLLRGKCRYETAIESMRPGSNSNLKHIEFIRKGIDATGAKHNIPIFIVCGHIDNINDYYEYKDVSDPAKASKVAAYNKGLSEFMSGQKEAYHDGAVPFSHQLGRGKSLKDIAAFSRHTCKTSLDQGNIDYVMPNKPDNVYIHVVEDDVFHGQGKITTCFPEFDNPKMLSSPQLFGNKKTQLSIIDWVDKIMPNENNVEQ